jgi:ABC-2 type transport system ATP-binding protein
MIEVQGLSKFYGSFQALADVSFSVGRGEVLGFLGPNGAGKSTTMKILTTYLSASEGTARVCGFDVHTHPLEVRRRVGYLPETPPLYGEMSVEEYLAFSGRARGLSSGALKSRLDAVVQECGLGVKRKSRIFELSKGYRQRTGLAQALIHDPEVLILDEPTSGLDPRQIIDIRALISRLSENRCIIFSTHVLQEATAVAARLVIINGGRKVADGTPDELASQALDSVPADLLVQGEEGGLWEVLLTVPGVLAVQRQPSEPGWTRYALEVAPGAAARAACASVVEAVQGQGRRLIELATRKRTLEDSFLQLLRREGGAAPAAAQTEPGDKAAPEAVAAVDEQASAEAPS